MKRIGYFQNLRIFLESFWIFLGIVLEFLGGFFWRNFFGGIFLEDFFWEDFLGGFFWEDFFGRIFWEDFLGGFFWEEFFGRNYLVEINKELMYFSRF